MGQQFSFFRLCLFKVKIAFISKYILYQMSILYKMMPMIQM